MLYNITLMLYIHYPKKNVWFEDPVQSSEGYNKKTMFTIGRQYGPHDFDTRNKICGILFCSRIRPLEYEMSSIYTKWSFTIN